MKKGTKGFTLRVSPEILKKFEYVAKYDDRSMNWLLTKIVCKCIAEFETQHGKIELPNQQPED